jgi:hypothetical protein
MEAQATVQSPPDTPSTPPVCRNCDTVLTGEYCHVCGQARRGDRRQLGGFVSELLDTVFEYDGRLWRTLGPLMARPGHLSLEFFRGRRARYVNPFRLFFFLTVIAFFAAQFAFDIDVDPATAREANGSSIASAMTVEEVERRRDDVLDGIDQAMGRVEGAVSPTANVGREAARAAITAEADRRIVELTGAAERGEPPPAPRSVGPSIRFGTSPSDTSLTSVTLDWLPETLAEPANRWLARAEVNQRRIREDPALLINAFLSSVPATLFVIVPIFALLLRMVYLFSGRRYMEHLIVTFHSHAFFSASLLALIGLTALSRLFDGGALARPLGWLQVALFAWMPLYVLLMQKRVYRQGWGLTVLKFWFLGVCYLLLLTAGVVVNLLFNLVSL